MTSIITLHWVKPAHVYEVFVIIASLQIERDEYRAKLHVARQSIRQQYLEKERQLRELLAAKEGALQAEKELDDPKASKPKKKEKSKSPSAKKKK